MLDRRGGRAHENERGQNFLERRPESLFTYSRKDLAFADRLDGALKARGFESPIDRSAEEERHPGPVQHRGGSRVRCVVSASADYEQGVQTVGVNNRRTNAPSDPPLSCCLSPDGEYKTCDGSTRESDRSFWSPQQTSRATPLSSIPRGLVLALAIHVTRSSR